MLAWSRRSRISALAAGGISQACQRSGFHVQPVVHVRRGVGHRRQDRGLVDDAVVERRRLEEEHERVCRRPEAGRGPPSVGAWAASSSVVKTVGALVVERPSRPLGQQVVGRRRSPPPTRTPSSSGWVAVAKWGGHERRERPVEQPRREPVVLGEREPVPDRGPGRSRCAYLRKLRIRWRSTCAKPPPRRERLERFV